MPLRSHATRAALLLLALFGSTALCQPPAASHPVTVTVLDENGAPVSHAALSINQPGAPPLHAFTDYAGRAHFLLPVASPYSLQTSGPGFYDALASDQDPDVPDVHIALHHQQILAEQVTVIASQPGIDPERVSDLFTLNVPDIVNIPYPTSRDIRNILPFYPGVVQDATGQIHIAGSETWATLDLLDHFNIRSPISGQLAMRFSADAVRSIDQETTRYPVQYGRATGGVVAFYTGMGDNKLRFNATNFIPSFRNINGLRFDKIVPRVTFSGPILRNRAWFFNGAELEYDNIYVQELPDSADTNQLLRGSNLLRVQTNTSRTNTLSAGLLYNGYHSPYDGISSLVPQISTLKRNTTAWLPYVRDAKTFSNGDLLDIGIGLARFRDGYTPHGTQPYDLTPELSAGSYFETLTSHSQRLEANADLYLPPRQALGRHLLQAGLDADRITFSEDISRAPVNYLREDRTLLRQSTFPAFTPYTRHNVETGAYAEDRWTPHANVLLEPGLRFDWDEILRRPLLSPRLGAVYTPAQLNGATKLSAGIGLYYEHTQLEYLTRALAGVRTDTNYAPDGVTPITPPLLTQFTYNPRTLHEARALNWSIALEQKLPFALYAKAELIRKRVSNEFVYAALPASPGVYTLTNAREDHDRVTEIEARRSFRGNYTLFAAYTHSTAHTNAALDYTPNVSISGPQQPGPLPWDTPNRLLSWGWLPFPLPVFRSWFGHRLDFVYALDTHTGFPYTGVNASRQIAGGPGQYRFPRYVDFSPGVEWKFHFHGSYFGLRAVMENATGSANPATVNNVTDSPQFGAFTQPAGRSVTARIRLIETK